jgi:hypothetical protein
MTDITRDDDRDEPIEEVVRDTVDATHDPTTRREAVEQELEDRGRSDEGAEVEVADVVDDAPAAGVLDEDRVDPPEPSEPG